MNAPAVRDMDAIVEAIITRGDLSGLSPKEKASYYLDICKSLGLNAALKPFDLMTQNGKEVLYANKNCGEQMRNLHKISVTKLESKLEADVYTVTAYVKDGDGREDAEIGAVPLPETLKGEARANATMKAVTKAKRRATLSICGLGMLDESEVETIPGARVGRIDLAPQEGAANAKFIEAMEKQRTRVGDRTYYDILGGAGYENASQITDRNSQKFIYALFAEQPESRVIELKEKLKEGQ